ncbi:hypothetical protein F5B20DRAFT_584973 [Whalleya microplaca]|nr:hypothetical protein F5B20DRAFT_584973 [Whalleya microplaca]
MVRQIPECWDIFLATKFGAIQSSGVDNSASGDAGTQCPSDTLPKACRELGVTMVAESPVSRGLPSGQIKSRIDPKPSGVDQFYPHFWDEDFPKT